MKDVVLIFSYLSSTATSSFLTMKRAYLRDPKVPMPRNLSTSSSLGESIATNIISMGNKTIWLV